MSWDKKKRGGGRGYFYKSVRVDGRAVKQYLGTGAEALEAARLVEGRRAARAAVRQEEIRLSPADLLLDELEEWLGVLLRAHLILGGFYEHHGEWRRRGRRG
jgi:hypothetical protein